MPPGGAGNLPVEVRPVTNRSPSAEKIALFRSLFRGRTDVYPRRFVSRKTGKPGYAPASANEWVRGVCEKPRVKCADCPNQRFFPVTDETVRWHLSGEDAAGREFVMGLYPMLLDESCFFLAVDLDGKNWREDAAALLDTFRDLRLPAALERSRSGNGGHVWFFFEEAIPAQMARKLGSHILTETMERRPDLGLDSYDRLFPNQDTLPNGGFGNLIALPLQKTVRERGNTVFLDPPRFEGYPDQWAYLSSLPRIELGRIEVLVNDAERRGRVVGVRMDLAEDDHDAPWTAPPSRRGSEPPIPGPLPEKIELVLADAIYVSKEGLPPPLRNRLIRLAAFQNPEFCRAQAMRLSTYDKPRIIHCAEDHPQHIALPRDCLEEVGSTLRKLKIKTSLRDERQVGKPLEVSFHGSLRPDQSRAVEAMMKHEVGVLSATTAFGKTVIAAWLIARRGVNTLVLVYRRQLLDQWVERLADFLGVTAKSIGRLGGGRKKLTGSLDVALIQSLVHRGVVDDRIAEYGQLVVDECHHISAHSFELAARRAKAKYVTGLSATVTRKDGHHPIVCMQCGPVRHHVDARQQADARPFHHQVFVRPTGFKAPGGGAGVGGTGSPDGAPDPRIEFQELVGALQADQARNTMICTDVVETLREGRSPLVLTERTEHLEGLAACLITLHGLHPIVLRGGLGKKQLREALDRLSEIPETEPQVVVATGRFIGEGFDNPRLDTLLLALPVSWRGTIAQYAGRLHRLHDGKREVRVYDYADLNVPMLAKMFDRRCRGYESLGYTILLPASALPGWPMEVPLPVDPVWKRDYAASVNRLIRDGLDVPLAHLFVHVARRPAPDAEGAERARSASEAFLYGRLETLPQTKGRFRLNERLPIPFDNYGRMEVDLVCVEHRLVIEIDGAQHLETGAYRRDRRKDVLLQRHGYFILRFLAEDVGRCLDQVLDTILATLVHCENRPPPGGHATAG